MGNYEAYNMVKIIMKQTTKQSAKQQSDIIIEQLH